MLGLRAGKDERDLGLADHRGRGAVRFQRGESRLHRPASRQLAACVERLQQGGEGLALDELGEIHLMTMWRRIILSRKIKHFLAGRLRHAEHACVPGAGIWRCAAAGLVTLFEDVSLG